MIDRQTIKIKYREFQARHGQIKIAIADAERRRDDLARRLLSATPQEAESITRDLKIVAGDLDELIAKVDQEQRELDRLKSQFYGGAA